MKLKRIQYYTVHLLVFVLVNLFHFTISVSHINASINASSPADEIEAFLIEQQIRYFQKELVRLKSKGIPIRGFYHTSTWKEHWKLIIKEQMFILDGKRKAPIEFLKRKQGMDYEWYSGSAVSLLEASEELYFMEAVSEKTPNSYEISEYVRSLNLTHMNKVKFHRNYTVGRNEHNTDNAKENERITKNMSLSAGEYVTVRALQNYCIDQVKLGKSAYVYYFHNKGACCIDPNHPVKEWRDEMNAFIIEFPSICLNALFRGYSACGTDNQEGHFSGNFWWANCDHIASIDPLTLNWRFDFYYFEKFIGYSTPVHKTRKNFFDQCGYTPYSMGWVKHYDKNCPRTLYRNRLVEHMTNDYLPSALTGLYGNNYTDICIELRSLGKEGFVEKGNYYHGLNKLEKTNKVFASKR
eukprot:gene14485-19446_t